MNNFYNHSFIVLILCFLYPFSGPHAQSIILTTNTTSNWTITKVSQPISPAPLDPSTDWLINPTPGVLNDDWTSDVYVANLHPAQYTVNSNVGNGSQPLWITEDVCNWVDDLSRSAQYNFRNTFTIEDCSDITSATLRYACDNLSRIYINGKQILSANGFYQYPGISLTCNEICGNPNGSPVNNVPASDYNSLPFDIIEIADVRALLVPGVNVIAMEIVNVGGCGINYAWINANLQINYTAGIVSSNVNNIIHKTCEHKGSFSVTGTGGQGPYTYQVEGGSVQDNGNFENLEPGTYIVTIKDSKGCVTTRTIVVEDISEYPLLNVDLDDLIDCADQNTFIEVNVVNGGGNTLFALDNEPFGTVNYFENLSPGNHTIVVTNGGECVTQYNFTIVEDFDFIQKSIRDSICQGQSISLFGKEYSDEGIYYDTIPGMTCDTILTIEISAIAPHSTHLSYEICNGQSVTVGDITYTAEGEYVQYVTNQSGCQDPVYIEIDEVAIKSETIDYSICSGSGVSVNGIYYDQEGEYTQTLITSYGCDSVLTISISVNFPQTSTLNYEICAGEIIKINNVEYNSEGSYTQTLTSSTGCDSLLNIVIAMTNIKNTYQNYKICSGDSVIVNNVSYKSGGQYSQLLTTHAGCDSILHINVEQLNVARRDFDYEICAGETIEINNIKYNSSGNYQQILTSSNGCDSLLNIFLSVLPKKSSSLEYSICLGDSAWYDSKYYNTEGDFVLNFEDNNGCDSTVNLRVSFKDIQECEDGICGKFFIPNVFTPNYDGINDEFEINVNNVTITYMAIFNRWGGLVWDSREINPKWDGYYGDLEAEPGVYVYMIRGHCSENRPIFKYGDVTLVR